MMSMSMIVHVTRTILPGNGPDEATTAIGPTDVELTDRIIVDFRATLTQLKCASSERLLRLGISMAQLNILYTLQRNGEMTMRRLADVLNVSFSNATGLVDRIEERGFIERTRVPEDRRVVMVRITPVGQHMLDEVDALSDDLLRTVLGRLDGEQLDVVARAVTDLRDALAATTGMDAPPRDRHARSTLIPRSA